MEIRKRIGTVGIALWDHGEYNLQGKHYCDLHQGQTFYLTDLRYKLREYRSVLDGLELQKESLYQYPNNSWEKIEFFYQLQDFLPFFIRNDFLSIHCRSRACDISSLKEENREWAARETTAGIDFGFRIGANALTLHPGSLTEQLNEDALLGIQVDWMYGVQSHNRRIDAFLTSLRTIIRHFLDRVRSREWELAKLHHRYDSYSMLASMLAEYRRLWKAPQSQEECDERGLLSAAIQEIEQRSLPEFFVRHLMNPLAGTHLCLENVEPFNFLINLPGQHISWLQIMREIHWSEGRRLGLSESVLMKYQPYLVVDTNHYLNSQVILSEHPELEWIYGSGYEDVFQPFVQLPGDYHEQEPLLNGLIRQFGDDILFYHIAGTRYNGFVLTHERIQPFRTHVATTEDETGKPIFRYGLNNFDPDKEINLEEVIQVIGSDQTFILEVFNASSECLKNSHENVKSFINYVASLRKLCTTKLLADSHFALKQQENPGLWNLDSMGFLIKSHGKAYYDAGGVGFDRLKFFRFDDSAPFRYRIMATMTENQEIWVNPNP